MFATRITPAAAYCTALKRTLQTRSQKKIDLGVVEGACCARDAPWIGACDA